MQMHERQVLSSLLQLKRQNYLSLHHIVDEAHVRYLKQSHLSKKPSFNILRILTCFREMFPTSPDRLYKPILQITKKYNPQTLEQWRKAIDKLKNGYDTQNSLMQSRNNNHQKNQYCQQQNRTPSQPSYHDFSIEQYVDDLDSQICNLESRRNIKESSSHRRVNIATNQTLRLQDCSQRMQSEEWDRCNESSDPNFNIHDDKENCFKSSNLTSIKNSENSQGRRSHQNIKTVPYSSSNKSLHQHLISFQPTQQSCRHNQSQYQLQHQYQQQQNLKNSTAKSASNLTVKRNKPIVSLNKTYKFAELQPQSYVSKNNKINPYHQITKIGAGTGNGNGIDNLSQILDRNNYNINNKDYCSNNYDRILYSNGKLSDIETGASGAHSKTNRQNIFLRNRMQGLINSKDSFEILSEKRGLIHNRCLTTGSGKQNRSLNNFRVSVGAEYYYSTAEDENEFMDQEQTEAIRKSQAFYEFKIKLNSFSSILSNYQAFDYFRHLRQKADVFRYSCLVTNSVMALKKNVFESKRIRYLQKKADKMHNYHTCYKAMKILKVLFGLRFVDKNLQSTLALRVQRFSPICYEFIIGLLFKQKQDETPQHLELQRKVNVFGSQNDYQKLLDISCFFGLDIATDTEQIKVLFDLYDKSVMIKAFGILRKNKMLEQKKCQRHQNVLKKHAFALLRINGIQNRIQKQKNQKASDCYHNKIYQKTFKAFLNIYYSTNLLTKKINFLKQNHQLGIKDTVIRLLKTKTIERQAEKLKYNNKILKGSTILLGKLLKLSFRKIKFQSFQIQRKTSQSFSLYQQTLARKFFMGLAQVLKYKKRHLLIFQFEKSRAKARCIRKWVSSTKRSVSSRIMASIFKKILFRVSFVPLVKASIKNILLKKQEQQNRLKQYFSNWKLLMLSRQRCLQQNKKMFEQKMFKTFCQQLCQQLLKNAIKNKRIKRQSDEDNKILSLRNQIENFRIHLFFNKMTIRFSANSHLQQSSLQLNKAILKFKLLQTQNRIFKNKKLCQEFLCFEKFLHEKYAFEIIMALKLFVKQKKIEELKSKTGQKIKAKVMTIFVQFHQQILHKMKLGKNHFTKKCSQKALLSMVYEFVEISNKCQQCQKVIISLAQFQYLSQKRTSQTLKRFKEKKNSLKLAKLKAKQFLKLSFIKSLSKRSKIERIQRQSLQQINFLRQKSFYQKLISFKDKPNIEEQVLFKERQLHMKAFWRKFESYFSEQLVQKKYSLMAFKFRSLKLSQISFKALQKNVYKHRNNNIFIQEGKHTKHMYKPTSSS